MNWMEKIGNRDPGKLLIIDKGDTATQFNCRKIRNNLPLNLEYREQQYRI